MKSKNLVKVMSIISALSLTAGQTVTLADETGKPVTVTIDTHSETKEISPYIYGINEDLANLKYYSVNSIRWGGNRSSAYNWETNLSNAGSDYYNLKDFYALHNVRKELKQFPAAPAHEVMEDMKEFNVPYGLMTLQMLGYVSDNWEKDEKLTAEQAAPDTKHWAKVENRKDGELSLEPDTTDGVVYMDEFMNYLVKTFGDSQNGGFKGISLDNEPSLWSGTHKLVQKEKLKCTELIEKTKDLAAVIKELDPNVDVFGPALYGYMAFVSLQGSPDWNEVKKGTAYKWFVDYYLDEMKKAEDEAGHRLVDILDFHYYTEAKGACGTRTCDHYDDKACNKARMDAVRSLWDPNYVENSWIGDNGCEFFPLFDKMQESIDTYYPGTKMAVTEYDFGGGDHITGGIAEADFLGTCAKYGVYFTTLWSYSKNAFQLGAINMFTNYDDNGTGFGDMLITGTESSDDYAVGAYSAFTSTEDDGTVRVILTNKGQVGPTPVTIKLDSDLSYSQAEMYQIKNTEFAKINHESEAYQVKDNELTLELEPLSITELVIKTAAEEVAETTEAETESEKATEDTSVAPETTTAAPAAESEGNSGMLIGIIAGVFAVVALALGFIFTKKKK